MRKFFLLPLLLAWLNFAWPQVNKATLSFQLTFPRGGYKKTYPITSTGLLFGIVHQLKEGSSISAGGELGFLQVSGDHHYHNSFLVSSYNHIVTLGLVVRADLLEEDKRSDLFVDVKFGTNLFLTAANISKDVEDPVTNNSRVVFYYSEYHSSFSLRAGAGLGFETPLGKKRKIMLVLKGSYLYGSHAKYYSRPTIKNMDIILHPRESKTSMILAETGIRFAIFNKRSRH